MAIQKPQMPSMSQRSEEVLNACVVCSSKDLTKKAFALLSRSFKGKAMLMLVFGWGIHLSNQPTRAVHWPPYCKSNSVQVQIFTKCSVIHLHQHPVIQTTQNTSIPSVIQPWSFAIRYTHIQKTCMVDNWFWHVWAKRSFFQALYTVFLESYLLQAPCVFFTKYPVIQTLHKTPASHL